MRRSSRTLPTPVIAVAVGGGLALLAVMIGSFVLVAALLLGLFDSDFLASGMGPEAADVEDDDPVDEPPDAMVVEEPVQPRDFPQIMERLVPPDRPRAAAPAGPMNDGRWQADLNARKFAEARLFVLADQVDHWMNQLATAQRSRNTGEQHKATQELEKVQRAAAEQYEHVDKMDWTPLGSRSDADLLAERRALFDDLQTLVDKPSERLSQKFKLHAAEQHRTRIRQLEDAIAN